MQDHLRYAAIVAEMSDSELINAHADIIDSMDLTGEQQAVLDEVLRRSLKTEDDYNLFLRLASDAQSAADDIRRIGDDALLIAQLEQRASFFRDRAREARHPHR